MDATGCVTIRRFAPDDQAAARECVLAGLADHFPDFRPELNPDLDDIAVSYADATFLVATRDGVIVGTGAVQRQADGTASVVRMSTARAARRFYITPVVAYNSGSLSSKEARPNVSSPA